jgi:branched-chain amino acid transport system substrate-binding protein
MSQQIFRKGFLALAVTTALGVSSFAQADIKIGVAGPFTGANAAFGGQFLKGAEQAAADINAKGGINGEKIVLVQGDDACEPKQAVAVANRLVDQDKVAAVVGHFCSSSTIPASEIYADAGVLAITPASTNINVTERGLKTMLRMCGRDDQQGIVAADYLVKTLKFTKIALIHDKDTYGQGLADATKMQMGKLGVKEVMYEGITRGEKDYNATVTKIKQSGAEAVFFGGLHAEAGPLVRQMREQGLKAVFMSDDGIVTDEMVTTAGGAQYTKGVLMTFGADPRLNASSKSVVEEFKKAGYEPEGYTLYAYASLQVIAAAFNGIKGTDGAKATEWVKAHEIDTVMGKKGWDAKGDLKVSDYVMYEWDANGKYSQIK